MVRYMPEYPSLTPPATTARAKLLLNQNMVLLPNVSSTASGAASLPCIEHYGRVGPLFLVGEEDFIEVLHDLHPSLVHEARTVVSIYIYIYIYIFRTLPTLIIILVGLQRLALADSSQLHPFPTG